MEKIQKIQEHAKIPSISKHSNIKCMLNYEVKNRATSRKNVLRAGETHSELENHTASWKNTLRARKTNNNEENAEYKYNRPCHLGPQSTIS